ncbi:MAG: hypothetical protein K0U86_23980 [Planctomycetes bacterium]|nr:hypothetical protein [Planctomycetota bacterium]MCH9727974.1 hypothetical protein [Planctomycetota bacterium]MCH9775776.1 hypothetical protein [Planctomycetota bacterium]MCH9792246.1 hypothetical protein [Planctomycetota bacterium]
MNKILEEQLRYNLESRPNWEHGKGHRETLTGYLVDMAGAHQQRRLCILGAGNCNDLDLKQLSGVFSEIHLVDLDESALAYAIQFQSIPSESAVFVHTCDLTGVGQQLAAWEAADSDADVSLAKIIQQLSKPALLDLPGPFDVVCSTCLLSQLVHLAVNTVGDTHARFEELMIAIRAQHFQTMIDLMEKHGSGLLVSDFVSSTSAPDMPQVPDEQLMQYLSQLLSTRNFFHGMHPGVLLSLLVGNTPLASQVRDVEMLPPWRWDLGSRQYAIAAIRFYGLKRV